GPVARRAKQAVQVLLRAEAPAWPIYRLLAAERVARIVVARNLVRAAYSQPILRTMCAACGERLLVGPGNGPAGGHRLPARRGRAPSAGAARTDARRPRLAVGHETYPAHRLIITADDEVAIGAHVRIADDVYLCSYDAHPMDPIARRTAPGPVDYSGRSRIVI